MNNNQQLKSITDRIKYMRDILDITADDMAASIGMTLKSYNDYENCQKEIPISMIYNVATVMNIDPTELLTGECPRMNGYSVTRNGHGVKIERFQGYSFESLAANFINRDKEPMLVTISPGDKKPQLVTHGGQEFNMVLKGKVSLVLGAKTIILQEGDSVYFDPQIPHGQFALDGEAKFLTVIDKE